MTVTTALEQAAVTLAEHGYYVFPCKPGDKTPLTSTGFKAATRDERQILHWWESHPDANIGIACGASGIAVLDIDAKHGANPKDILDGSRPLHGAPIVFTGTAPDRDDHHPRSLPGVRGAQVYFRGHLPTGDLVLDGCEIRGDGAYVIAPPSLHPSGIPYGPVDPPAISRLPEPPDWLVELSKASHRHSQATREIGETIAKGEQHKTLASLAGSMRRRGMGADEIEAALLVTNSTRLEDPAPAEDIRRIAESVAKYAPAQALNGASAIAHGDERFVVEITEKGQIKLPEPVGRDDQAGHCAWLTSVFKLHPSHPVTHGVRQGSRGADGHIVLVRLDAPALRFEPASRINTPQKLTEDLAWQLLPMDDAVPAFKGEHCRQIAHVIRMLCGASASQDAAQETAGIIGSYLSVGTEVRGHTTYGDGRERYAAAEALKRETDERTGRQVGPPRYLLDENTGELVVPLDELQTVARAYMGTSLARGWLDGRMEDLGWHKATLDGHGLPGRDGRLGPHNRRVVYRGLLPAVEQDQAA